MKPSGETKTAADDNLRAYLLLRGDLPSLGRGKGAAHAMHAGNHMTSELLVKPLMAGRDPDPRAVAWHAQGDGFGTTMSIGGPGDVTAERIERLVDTAGRLGLLAGIVVDRTYPYLVDDEILPLIRADVHTEPPRRRRNDWLCHRSETTAAWVLGAHQEIDVLLGRYALSPDT